MSALGRLRPCRGGRDLPPGYPSLERVCTARVPTRKFVPSKARQAWAAALATALNEIAVHNDELAWIHFFMLPQAVLGGKKLTERGGDEWTTRITKVIRKRSEDWIKGDRRRRTGPQGRKNRKKEKGEENNTGFGGQMGTDRGVGGRASKGRTPQQGGGSPPLGTPSRA